MLPTFTAATLWLALAAAPAEAPAPTEQTPLLYDLTPYATTAPELLEAWNQRQTPADAHTALGRALMTPADQRTGPWRDPHTVLVAHWLLADGHLRQGQLDAALPHAEAVRSEGSGLVDPLVTPLSEQLVAGKRTADAGRWGFAHLRPGSGMRDHAVRAAQRLRKSGAPEVALQLVRALLRRSLAVHTRRALVFLAAELEVATGDNRGAVTRLRRLWWETSSKEVRSVAARHLAALDARPGQLEELAEIAFETRSRKATEVRRTLQRLRKRTRRPVAQRVIIWARALIAGLDKDKRAESEEVVAKYTRKLRRTDAEPWAMIGHAKALRRLDRDVAAAQVYEDMGTRFPDHPLAAHALGEAAGLYMGHGLPGDADVLYARIVGMDQHGRAEREALWQVGFTAFLQGNDDLAVKRLSQLVSGYEGERDGLGVTWTERAQYWWARAEARRGNLTEAARLYDGLIHRFPIGWYALLATARRQGLPPVPLSLDPGTPVTEGLSALRVVRRSMLDHPVALIRLGEDQAAIEVLKALFASGQLMGSGRALLAALYRRQGDEDKAASLLRRHAVLAEVPGPADSATYSPAYVYKYGDLIESMAGAHGFSPSLLAGLVHVESRFNPKARSGAGAIGLTQLMPGTARIVSKRLYGRAVSLRKVRRPETNLELGATLVRRLLNRFRGQLAPALAAYNAGPGAATSWLRRRGHLPMDAWVETIPYDQTRHYVMRVTSVSEVYRRLYRVRGQAPALPMALPTALGSFDGDAQEASNEEETPPPEPAP
ncbi:MAG: transglycosylase SLT domain-containing protein [Myxococcota bacterium]|jgi:soluble lytic murein transglycosylase|nr:transglycosylase SLT domain-containing protein [Myxococcota bacterium]